MNGKQIAVVVPGTWDTVSDRIDLALWLSNVGFSSYSDKSHFFDYVLGINYNTLASPADTGNLLAADIQPLISGGASICIFAHSQGGLVSRWGRSKRPMRGTLTGLVMFADLRTRAFPLRASTSDLMSILTQYMHRRPSLCPVTLYEASTPDSLP